MAGSGGYTSVPTPHLGEPDLVQIGEAVKWIAQVHRIGPSLWGVRVVTAPDTAQYLGGDRRVVAPTARTAVLAVLEGMHAERVEITGETDPTAGVSTLAGVMDLEAS